ncbi:MAG: hypothetical protein AAB682_02525 [Patescibacteria group bacterium]
MKVGPIHEEIIAYLTARKLISKFEKQLAIFRENPFHPGLNAELLEPKHLRLWSFRIDRKYRAVFIFHSADTVEILTANNHYR